MKLLVVGSDTSQAEFRAKFGHKHSITFKKYIQLTVEDIESPEAIFDFSVSPDRPYGQIYNAQPQTVLFVNSVNTTVADLVEWFDWSNPVIGFNGMPKMFNRPILELAIDRTDLTLASQLCQNLGTDYKLVKDGIGMVTPRVICMIINEACYTVQQETANKKDIDLAMKLGTNYPQGPFEMLDAIGTKNVVQLLEALHQSTGDERYRVCPWLKKLSQPEV